MNATPTSYSTSSPSFTGSSSSSPTLEGVYSGANGDTTLTFTASLGGIVGTTPVQLEVRDSQNNLVDTVNTGFDPPGTKYTLSNGLELSLSAGDVQLGDAFQVDVYATTGSAVRPGNAFNGSGDAGPGFESGFAVGAGSFEVNGVSIAVLATDSLNDVLARITASAAGVTATFDATSENVVLTQDSAGSGFDIALANDTSGLLAATKLDTATSVLGSEDETELAISQIASLSGIQSGTFGVNGITLSLDVTQDSIADLVDLINGSGAGVTASFNLSTSKLTLVSSGPSLELEDGTSGVFSELQILEGTYLGKQSRSGTRFVNENRLRRNLDEFARAYEAVFEGAYSGFGSPTVNSIRKELNGMVTRAFKTHLKESGSSTIRSGLGIDFASDGSGYRTLDVNSSQLGRALDDRTAEVVDLLFADETNEDRDGFVTALGNRIDGILETLGRLLGPEGVGLGLDVSA